MEDGSPVDASIFWIDSEEYELLEEINNPRQFTITSDGSSDHQGEFNLILHYSYANDPWPAGE